MKCLARPGLEPGQLLPVTSTLSKRPHCFTFRGTNRLDKVKSGGHVREKGVLPIAYVLAINCAKWYDRDVLLIDRSKRTTCLVY